VLETSTALDLICIPQPKGEHSAVREVLRILEERLESAAETLFTRSHLRVGKGADSEAMPPAGAGPRRRGKGFTSISRDGRHHRFDLVLDITEKGGVADRERWDSR
jgi:hypothetical protein